MRHSRSAMTVLALACADAPPSLAEPGESRWSITLQQSTCSSQEWDSFAQQCGTSFLCAYNALKIWQLNHQFYARVRTYDILLSEYGSLKKIGQFAISSGYKLRVFTDSIQLLPEYQPLWQRIMTSILAELGPGVYRYGSDWSLEPPREQALEAIPGVKIEAVKPITVDAVDFSRWPTWDDYLQAISTNIRRNVARSKKTYTDLFVRVRRGVGALIDGPILLRLRAGMYRRKNVHFSSVSIISRYVIRMIALRRYAVVAVASTKSQALAGCSGIDFGDHTYYIEGGCRTPNNGAAWHLLLCMLRRTYGRTGSTGKFVMGCGGESSTGLARSRQQCRVTSHPTSIVFFRMVGHGTTPSRPP